MSEQSPQMVWDRIREQMREQAKESEEHQSMDFGGDVPPPPDEPFSIEHIAPLPIAVEDKSRPLPDAIVEAQERYVSADEARRREAEINGLRREIRESWDRLYVARPQGDHKGIWQWMIRWACRLQEFGLLVTQAGYAENVNRLKGADTISRVAIALLIEARDGDDGRLLELIRNIPVAVEWWSYFNSPFPESTFDAESPDPADGPEDESPKHYLFGWREILDALGLKNDETNKRRVAQLNQLNEGPIIVPGQGSHPRVDKSRLIAWWNTLDSRWEELEHRERDRRATVESTHPYGKDGTVLPEIHGAEKSRRSPKR